MSQSAGLLMFRSDPELRVLIAHPGGPFFAKKDEGAWSIPKGLVEAGENALETARREFSEETSLEPPDGPFIELGEVVQRGGKRVLAWAFRGDCDPDALESNTFELEWPPRSGRKQSFPEVDRFVFASVDEARRLLNPAQRELVSRLEAALAD